jgi:dimethylaniline monooxygenase (N-oxide forming)
MATDTQSTFQRGLSGPPAGPNQRSNKRVAIIGAGACGIANAKYLLACGFGVTIFEIGSQIGGMWCYENDNGRSSAYRTLHINTSRGVTRFSDLAFDAQTQPFPDHVDMHRYLVGYAEHFDVVPHIRFNTPVRQIRPTFDLATEPPRWEVETGDGTVEAFDAVIVASGHLTRPMEVPAFQGFGGEYLHAHHYREPDPYVGKRVCVVGVGNSACDIASDLCVTSPRCVLVARSGVVVLPKLMFGQAFTDITAKIQRPWIPRGLRRRLVKFLVWLVHGDMAKLGFKPPTELTHVTSNATVCTDIAYRRIEVKHGIEAVDGKTLCFEDGTAEEFDVLIAATGYEIDLDFIPPEVMTVENNELDLYLRIVPPDWPGLFLQGFFNTDTALNMVFEHQARWVREILLDNASLPRPDVMRGAIAERKAWYASQYKHTPRHTIEEEHVRYMTDLKKSLKTMLAAPPSGTRRRGAA